MEEYERLCPYQDDLHENWGPPPGHLNSDGQHLLVFGARPPDTLVEEKTNTPLEVGEGGIFQLELPNPLEHGAVRVLRLLPAPLSPRRRRLGEGPLGRWLAALRDCGLLPRH